jgi:Fe-S cluster biogenesis protein NfuA
MRCTRRHCGGHRHCGLDPQSLKKEKKMEINEKVEKALDTVRPGLKADGGDVKLVGVDDGIVKVQLMGHCVGCPMAQMTLQHSITQAIKEAVPEIKEVLAV